MSSSKKLLSDSKLYVILDRSVKDYSALLEITKKAVNAGVKIVQLRDKFGCARDIVAFSRRAMSIVDKKCLFIVNDRVDIACAVNAHGVHLGQDDLNTKEARRILGKNKLIGVSCQSMTHALKAQKDGADYLGFGSVFKTLTKPDRQPMPLQILKEVYGKMRIPVFAIGGITTGNVSALTKLGVNRVAVCRDVLVAKEVASKVKTFLQNLS